MQKVEGFISRWEITVTPNGNDDVRISLPRDTVHTFDFQTLSRGVAVSIPRAPLTARFESVPEGHDGSTAFALQLAFSEPIETTQAALQQALMVTAGMMNSVQKVDGSSDLWEITVTPNGNDDVHISLPQTTSCDAEWRNLHRGRTDTGNRAWLSPLPRVPLTARFEDVPTGHHGIAFDPATCLQRTNWDHRTNAEAGADRDR